MHRCLEAIRRDGVILLLVWTPLAWPLVLFVALLVLQILPLPLSVLSLLSPATADLYRPFRPLWPALHTPISLHPYATRIALGLVLAYAGGGGRRADSGAAFSPATEGVPGAEQY
jgi:hypothetical protein